MSLSLYPNPAGVTTRGAATLLAAWLAGAAIIRTGPVGAFIDTTDTAANIVAALNMPAGASWICQYINSSGFTCTLTAGSGVTLSGASASIPTNTLAQLAIYVSPAGAVDIKVLYRTSTV